MADLTKTLAVTNGFSAAPTSNSGAASQTLVVHKDERLILRISNSDAAAARVTVKAGDGIASALGDSYEDIAQNGIFYAGPFESARFGDKDTGKITITITDDDGTAYSGTVTNVKIEAIQL